MTNRRLEDQLMQELDGRGPIGRAALAEATGVHPDTVSKALFGLKQAGLVVPAGDGRWATCTEYRRAQSGALPEGEGRVRVEPRTLREVVDRHVPTAPDEVAAGDPVEADLLSGELDPGDHQDEPAPVGAPPLSPGREPGFDLSCIDVERLHGELFNATASVRTALDLWVASDPVAYRLRTAARALTYAQRLLAELEA
jgi:DNA-binding transcriptional ArsR family regulator